jgi:hypothetical protein
MGNHKKVTYTLDRDVVDYLKIRSRSLCITHSTYVAQSIQMGYEMMMEAYDENYRQPTVGVVRKRPQTIPITVSLPNDVVETLNGFSQILNIKKSHLVWCCVRNRQIEEAEPFYQLVREFMTSIRKPSEMCLLTDQQLKDRKLI